MIRSIFAIHLPTLSTDNDESLSRLVSRLSRRSEYLRDFHITTSEERHRETLSRLLRTR